MSLLLDSLLRENLITEEQLNDAKAKHMGAKRPIQDLLVEMGFIREEDLLKISSQVFKMPVVDLAQEEIDPALTKLVSYDFAKRHSVFPVSKKADTLVVAMVDPQDIMAIDDLRSTTNLKIKPILCAKTGIESSIETYYQSDESVYEILKNVSEDTQIKLIKDDGTVRDKFSDGISVAEKAPVVRLVNLILHDAVKMRASDIHIEPQESMVKIRYRVDGELRNIMDIPMSLHSSLSARIKIIAMLDIAETRKPQDGRAKLLIKERKIDLRISTIPTFYGEKIEVRLLDPLEAKIQLETLGLDPQELKAVKTAITTPQGIVLVTGPTGSGKTSTLYAVLNFIKSETKNIVTIEDPIEYLIQGINQIQLNPAKEVTFASGLRSILRQDPNVILVGEIRDRDTADIAFRASLTGHLVLSTLHTNNSVASVTRLLDIGLEPYLVASSLSLVIGQRLVKVICPNCREVAVPEQGELEKLKSYIDEFHIETFYKGKGCSACDFSGFKGRIAIFEIFTINEEIRRLINNKANEGELRNEAKNTGLRPLLRSAMRKVAEGIITIGEVLKIASGVSVSESTQPLAKAGENIEILIADDDEDVLAVLNKRLKGAGYGVVMARDGAEAVELAHKIKPDLIITDATMPKMNGFELVKALRVHLETAVIPIVMLTARQDKESELKGLDAGADDYIIKPFDHEKLLARVKMLLRRTQAKNV